LLPQDADVAMDDTRMPDYKPVVEAEQPKAPDKLEVGAQLQEQVEARKMPKDPDKIGGDSLLPQDADVAMDDTRMPDYKEEEVPPEHGNPAISRPPP
jgi:hypothetical protein